MTGGFVVACSGRERLAGLGEAVDGRQRKKRLKLP